MKYDLKAPCKDCPFRTDCIKGWLGENRAAEIADSLIDNQKTFPCHKTTTNDSEGDTVENEDSQHCAGAMIMLEHIQRPNQMMRICERLGIYDHKKLDMEAPVFDDPQEFIEHHSQDN